MTQPKMVAGPELVYADESYADVCMYIHVPGGDWKLTVSRDMETNEIYESVEYGPDEDCFDETDKEMPADVRALFDASKPAAIEMLRHVPHWFESKPVRHISVKEGIATLANGSTVDLLKIQAALNSAHGQLGDQAFADAANELAKISGKWQGPHEEWYDLKED